MSSFRRVIKSDQVHWTPGQTFGTSALRPLPAPSANPEAAIAAAASQAQQMVQAAREQALEIQRAAQDNAAETLRQAHAEGLRQAEDEAAQLLLSAHGLVDEVEAWRQRVLAQSEPMIVELVGALARKLFGSGITLPPEVMEQAFNQALAEARPLGALRVRLNPADADVLSPNWPAAGSTGQNLERVPDPSIRRGGCLIEGEYGTVDARVESQLAVALDALTQTGAEAAESAEQQS